MKTDLIKAVNYLSNKSRVNQDIIKKFLQQINTNQHYTEKNNPAYHFCSFFVPINLESKSIYLGHHIKANDWIPPGGHIESEETPTDTVRREFTEELSHKLTTEKIELFDLSIKIINNPKIPCKIHYDLWHLVYIDKINFVYDQGEFFYANWFTLEKAIKLTKDKNYNTIIKKIAKLL